MELEKVKEGRDKLEREISHLINKFHHEFDSIKIDRVNIDFTELYSDQKSGAQVITSNVKITIKL